MAQVAQKTTLRHCATTPPPTGGGGGSGADDASKAVVAQNRDLPASPADAKRLGITTYFTGVACKRGHVAPRFTSSATCCECRASGLYRGNPETRRKWQREANRRERLARRGGCTPEMKVALIDGQGGKCATCGTAADLFVDHCHATDKIRGALCRSCNLALGMVKDQPELLRTLAAYLERHQ